MFFPKVMFGHASSAQQNHAFHANHAVGETQRSATPLDFLRSNAVTKPQNVVANPKARQQPAPRRSSVVTTQSGEQKVEVGLDPSRGREVGGSAINDFNLAIIRQTMGTIWAPASTDIDGAVNATLAALAAFKPTDEIEGMIAAQAVALHHATMECFRRAALPNQHSDVASKLRRDGANLARGMTDMLDALDRKRGKGPQVVRVERVVVHEGGQAIVGNVAPNPGGGRG
jgi:hypothetical protein